MASCKCEKKSKRFFFKNPRHSKDYQFVLKDCSIARTVARVAIKARLIPKQDTGLTFKRSNFCKLMILRCYDGAEHSKDLNVSVICFIARKVAVTTLFIHRNLLVKSVNVSDENIQYAKLNLKAFLF